MTVHVVAAGESGLVAALRRACDRHSEVAHWEAFPPPSRVRDGDALVVDLVDLPDGCRCQGFHKLGPRVEVFAVAGSGTVDAAWLAIVARQAVRVVQCDEAARLDGYAPAVAALAGHLGGPTADDLAGYVLKQEPQFRGLSEQAAAMRPCVMLVTESSAGPGTGRLKHIPLALVAISIALTACTADTSHPDTGLHPRSAYLVRPAAPVHSFVAFREYAPDIIRRLLPGSHLVTTIGSLEGDPATVFGSIQDVAIGNHAAVLVLDARFSDVRSFDQAGRLLWRVGRPGRGPGELTNPYSLLIDSTNRLRISDVTRRIHVFDVSGNLPRYINSLQLDFAALDICALGPLTAVHAVNPTETRPIHVVDEAGHTLDSFGEIYRSPRPDLNYALSKGRIACDAGLSTIYYTPSSGIGEVRAYRPNGEPLWVAVIRDYRPVRISDVKGGYAVAIPPEGFNRVETLTAIPKVGVLLQLGFLRQEPSDVAPTVRTIATVLLDAKTGAVKSVSLSIPRVQDLDDSLWISSQDDPFPAVIYYTR